MGFAPLDLNPRGPMHPLGAAGGSGLAIQHQDPAHRFDEGIPKTQISFRSTDEEETLERSSDATLQGPTRTRRAGVGSCHTTFSGGSPTRASDRPTEGPGSLAMNGRGEEEQCVVVGLWSVERES
jgi:hypothetical protein